MKKKKIDGKNYLDKIPVRNSIYRWSADQNGAVTLEVENKGVFNKIAQKLFKKPKISYIHLEETGSFIWPLIDGEKTVFDLGKEVEEKFGEASHPLYERLITYMNTLDSYGFITWLEESE